MSAIVRWTYARGPGPIPEDDATRACGDCEDGKVEVLDQAAIRPWTISPPYALVACETCGGSGVVVADCYDCGEPLEEGAGAVRSGRATSILGREREVLRHALCGPCAWADLFSD